jgi:3-hydroxybutyryl-CoA dehydratase
MENNIATFTIDKLKEGDNFEFSIKFSDDLIEQFSFVSGDVSPLHMNDDFARSRGFIKKVAHGVLQLAFLSKMIGVDFPGMNAIIQTIRVSFLKPVYAGDQILFSARVSHTSPGTRTMELKIKGQNFEKNITVMKGKIQVGFTVSS